MSDETEPLGARVPTEIKEAVEEAAREAGTSSSEIIRSGLRFALLESDDFEIPDWMAKSLKAQKIKKKGVDRRKMVGLLENRIPRQMDKLFQAQPYSWHPDNVEFVMQTYVEEAQARFGEGADEVDEVRDKIADELEDYREAYTASNWSPDDENRFMQLTGPEDGERESKIKRQGEAIAAEVQGRLDRGATDPQAVLDAIANERGVDRDKLAEMLLDATGAGSVGNAVKRLQYRPSDDDVAALGGATSDD